MSDQQITKEKKLSNEEIVAGFQQKREEQRAIVQKLQELESDRNEHKLVIQTLESVDSSRRCHRLIGGILLEQTDGEILPALKANAKQIATLCEQLREQLVSKGQQLTDYRQKHNIRLQNEPPSSATATASNSSDPKGSSGVLVG